MSAGVNKLAKELLSELDELMATTYGVSGVGGMNAPIKWKDMDHYLKSLVPLREELKFEESNVKAK